MTVSRNKKYNIDKKTADETLKNVFAACDKTPNSQPFDYILVRNIANTTMVKAGKRVAIVLLMLVIICPLAFRGSGDNSANNHKNPVQVVSHHLDKDAQRFVMEVTGKGIDYKGIYAKNESGEIIAPSMVDEKSGVVAIPFTEGTINIFIPNEDGTVTQAVLSK